MQTGRGVRAARKAIPRRSVPCGEVNPGGLQMSSREKSSSVNSDGEPLLAITLIASNLPIPMPTLSDEQLRGLALFKSRRVEDGRERFRLHLGYFVSYADAERVLAVVRPAYPRAMVAAVPQDSMGSLDNTAITRFSILQPALQEQAVPAPTPIVAALPMTAPSQSAAPAVSLAASFVRPPVQRFSVQLAFSREPIDISKLPQLAIYDGYLLYAIETESGGRRLYGIRLGFYDDALSARLVAQYVRSDFKEVAIVPVSEREVARATTAKVRLPASRVVRSAISALPLWPRSALTVAFDPGSHLSLAP